MGLMGQWGTRQRGDRARPGYEPTVPGAIDTGPVTGLRATVPPPSLMDDGDHPGQSRLMSLLPRLGGMRAWLQTGWARTDDAGMAMASERRTPPPRLQQAREAFDSALGDLDGGVADDLAVRARTAPTLRELWHLRNELFTLVAVRHCESIAQQRLAMLNACFAGPAARPHLRASTLARGHLGSP